jgi:hypothetical protein
MWLASYAEKQAAEAAANVAVELLKTFTRQTRYSIFRRHRRSLALDRRLEIANGLPKWTARMRSGLTN